MSNPRSSGKSKSPSVSKSKKDTPPKHVSKNATYYDRNFFPTESLKNIPKTKRVYLISDVNFNKGKVKQVYSKDALAKSLKQSLKKGSLYARSASGKQYHFRNAIPITTSPKRFQKLVSHLSRLPFAQGIRGVKPERAVLGYFGVDSSDDWFKVRNISNEDKIRWPKHYASHSWHKTNFLKVYDLIRDGKITTIQQIDDINYAFFNMEYGHKNPVKLIYKVLDGTLKREQVGYLDNIRRWIYGKRVGPQKDKINRFLERKVINGEITPDIADKLRKGPLEKNKIVPYIKKLFHK
jgi:hypothetical protein